MTVSASGSDQFTMEELVSVVDSETNAKSGFPHDVCDRLRRYAPIVKVEPGATEPFWMLTRQKEIRQVSTDSDRFTSSKRLIISTTDPTFEVVRFGEILPIASMDRPGHRKHRGVIAPGFLPSALDQNYTGFLAEDVEMLVEDYLSKDSEQMNISQFAEVLSIRAICKFMGLPEASWETVYACGNAISSATVEEHMMGNSPEESHQLGFAKLTEMFIPLIQSRQQVPEACMTSLIASSKIEDDPALDMTYKLSHCMSVFFGGMDTTRNALTAGMLAFTQFPEEYAKLRANPEELIDSAIEEILRYTTPAIQFARGALEDVQVGDTLVREGETVVMVYPSANRDEDVFDDPHAFRIDRTPNNHLTFGVGAHTCVGNRFSRLQLKAGLLELCRRIEAVEFIDDPVRTCAFLVPSFQNTKIGIRIAGS